MYLQCIIVSTISDVIQFLSFDFTQYTNQTEALLWRKLYFSILVKRAPLESYKHFPVVDFGGISFAAARGSLRWDWRHQSIKRQWFPIRVPYRHLPSNQLGIHLFIFLHPVFNRFYVVSAFSIAGMAECRFRLTGTLQTRNGVFFQFLTWPSFNFVSVKVLNLVSHR